MKHLKNIFVALLLTVSILTLSNPVYADENDTYDSVMYWGINDGTLYLSPTAQGYAVNEDIRDAEWKSSDDPYIELWCDWYDYANIIQRVEILSDGNERIKPITTTFWFYDFKNCTEINGLDNLDTSELEDCVQMFYNCESLKEVDLDGFYTGNVKYFSGMFEGCKNLIEIDVSNFETSKAKKIDGMFAGCEQLKTINVLNFDTTNVRTIAGLFAGCESLDYIDLSSFNTSNVENFANLFSFCNNLTKIDLSNFDFSNANTRIDDMFNNCSSLEKIDLSNFQTKNIKNFRNMFSGCSSLKELDLSSFDTTNLKYCDGMFSGCTSLEKITVGDKWVEHKYLTDDKDMFLNCVNLVGQSGTKYDENNVDSTYFCIDEGEERPGYLTLKVSDNVEEDNPSINEDITSTTETQQNSSLSLPIIITAIALVVAVVVFAMLKSKKK